MFSYTSFSLKFWHVILWTILPLLALLKLLKRFNWIQMQRSWCNVYLKRENAWLNWCKPDIKKRKQCHKNKDKTYHAVHIRMWWHQACDVGPHARPHSFHALHHHRHLLRHILHSLPRKMAIFLFQNKKNILKLIKLYFLYFSIAHLKLKIMTKNKTAVEYNMLISFQFKNEESKKKKQNPMVS